jgi:hypothetical protein
VWEQAYENRVEIIDLRSRRVLATHVIKYLGVGLAGTIAMPFVQIFEQNNSLRIMRATLPDGRKGASR